MKIRIPAQFRLHALVFALVLILDQLTKYWARARFSGPDGQPDYGNVIPVLGDWLQFRLVYNFGSAWGLRPQELLPFLHPVLFFTIITVVAIALLLIYYRNMVSTDNAGRLGLVLILTGAVGNNLIDRPIFHKVTDFIYVGIPDVYTRFPIFNIADSAVTIGILLIFIAPLFAHKKPEAHKEASDAI